MPLDDSIDRQGLAALEKLRLDMEGVRQTLIGIDGNNGIRGDVKELKKHVLENLPERIRQVEKSFGDGLDRAERNFAESVAKVEKNFYRELDERDEAARLQEKADREKERRGYQWFIGVLVSVMIMIVGGVVTLMAAGAHP